MNAKKHHVALMEVFLILPAVLFMASLVARNLPASTLGVAAQRTVMWYAERQWTLWLLLVALPLVVLVVGCVNFCKAGTRCQSDQAYKRHWLRFRPMALLFLSPR